MHSLHHQHDHDHNAIKPVLRNHHLPFFFFFFQFTSALPHIFYHNTLSGTVLKIAGSQSAKKIKQTPGATVNVDGCFKPCRIFVVVCSVSSCCSLPLFTIYYLSSLNHNHNIIPIKKNSRGWFHPSRVAVWFHGFVFSFPVFVAGRLLYSFSPAYSPCLWIAALIESILLLPSRCWTYLLLPRVATILHIIIH